MDDWGIKSLDELEPEPYKRFWSEIDDEWVSKNNYSRKNSNTDDYHLVCYISKLNGTIKKLSHPFLFL